MMFWNVLFVDAIRMFSLFGCSLLQCFLLEYLLRLNALYWDIFEFSLCECFLFEYLRSECSLLGYLRMFSIQLLTRILSISLLWMLSPGIFWAPWLGGYLANHREIGISQSDSPTVDGCQCACSCLIVFKRTFKVFELTGLAVSLKPLYRVCLKEFETEIESAPWS